MPKAKAKTVKIYYKPYPKQLEIHQSKAKYRIVCLGRRTGKTYCAAAEVLQRFSEAKRPLKIGWIAPSYTIAQRGLDTLKVLARDLIKAEMITINNTPPATVRMGDHICYFLSADNENSIRGHAFDFIVVDEAHYIDDKTFTDVILPLLMDTDGDMLAISTPRGKFGWFYTYFMNRKKSKNIKSFTFSTYDNPYIKNRTINELKKSMPKLSFEQEIMAKFVNADCQVFQDVDQCFTSIPCSCDVRPVMGVDLGRKVDDTVFISLCPACRRVKDMQIHKKTPWSEQHAKMVGWYKRIGATVLVIDGTGVGDVVQLNLQAEDINLSAVIMSAPKKLKIYTDLISQIEQGLIKWDNDRFPKIAVQMLALEREVKKTTIAYNAGGTEHDDIPDAIALALNGCLYWKNLHIYSFENLEDDKKKEDIDEDVFFDDYEDEEWYDQDLC